MLPNDACELDPAEPSWAERARAGLDRPCSMGVSSWLVRLARPNLSISSTGLLVRAKNERPQPLLAVRWASIDPARLAFRPRSPCPSRSTLPTTTPTNSPSTELASIDLGRCASIVWAMPRI